MYMHTCMYILKRQGLSLQALSFDLLRGFGEGPHVASGPRPSNRILGSSFGGTQKLVEGSWSVLRCTRPIGYRTIYELGCLIRRA